MAAKRKLRATGDELDDLDEVGSTNDVNGSGAKRIKLGQVCITVKLWQLVKRKLLWALFPCRYTCKVRVRVVVGFCVRFRVRFRCSVWSGVVL